MVSISIYLYLPNGRGYYYQGNVCIDLRVRISGWWSVEGIVINIIRIEATEEEVALRDPIDNNEEQVNN